MSNKPSVSQKQAQSAPQKGGKKSIKEIHAELGFSPVEEIYKNGVDDMDIDLQLKKELEEYDLACRFINFKKYKELGFHKRGWIPYKRQSKPKNTVLFNIDENGYMVRGDLVLAVKPNDHNEYHRKQLQHANARNEGIIKKKSDEFRELARSKGIEASVGDE